MITKKEVQHVAKLARIGITKKEEGELQKNLSSVLEYVEKLKKVDVSDVLPTSHPFAIENVMRQDTESSRFKAQNSKLLDLAPEVKEGYIKVKSILK